MVQSALRHDDAEARRLGDAWVSRVLGFEFQRSAPDGNTDAALAELAITLRLLMKQIPAAIAAQPDVKAVLVNLATEANTNLKARRPGDAAATIEALRNALGLTGTAESAAAGEAATAAAAAPARAGTAPDAAGGTAVAAPRASEVLGEVGSGLAGMVTRLAALRQKAAAGATAAAAAPARAGTAPETGDAAGGTAVAAPRASEVLGKVGSGLAGMVTRLAALRQKAAAGATAAGTTQ